MVFRPLDGMDPRYFGSPTWTRTRDLRINRASNFESSYPAFNEVYQRMVAF